MCTYLGSSPLDIALKTDPPTGASQCLIRISEAIQILKPLNFTSGETYEYILRKFVEEEIGKYQFRSLTVEIFQAMGIKNAGIQQLQHQQQQKYIILSVAVRRLPLFSPPSLCLSCSSLLLLFHFSICLSYSGNIALLMSQQEQLKLESKSQNASNPFAGGALGVTRSGDDNGMLYVYVVCVLCSGSCVPMCC